MALLGVAFPAIKGTQVVIDLFPEPEQKQSKKSQKEDGIRFDTFITMRLPKIDQRRIWEGFQRLLRVCNVPCWDADLVSEIVNVKYGDITPPRNDFLYKAAYWPLEDLTNDIAGAELNALLLPELHAENDGFLLRLGFLVYRLFEQLMNDLGEISPIIKVQSDGSRCAVDTTLPELDLYQVFAKDAFPTPALKRADVRYDVAR